jgi:hypothetical protein
MNSGKAKAGADDRNPRRVRALIGAPVGTSFFDALMTTSVLSMEGAIC